MERGRVEFADNLRTIEEQGKIAKSPDATPRKAFRFPASTATNQKVGSSSLSGRAIFFNDSALLHFLRKSKLSVKCPCSRITLSIGEMSIRPAKVHFSSSSSVIGANVLSC